MNPGEHPVVAKQSILYRLRIAIALFVLTMLVGVLGTMVLLDVGPVDAAYFTVATLATVGYGDIHPKDAAGRIFTTLFILVGFATASYSLTVLVQAIIEGELQGEIGNRRMQKRIDALDRHVVLCGFGRIGAELALDFASESIPFVVVDSDRASVDRAAALGYPVLQGDATSDDTLRAAGIDRARTIVPALASDVDNLFIVLSARQMNPSVSIVARAQDASTAEKMRKAGADRTVRPLHIGAQHLAQAVLRPTVLDFVQVNARNRKAEYAIEEVPVGIGSSLVDKTLVESNLRRDVGVILIGIKREKGDLVFNPTGDTTIRAGDTLVAMGDAARLDRLRAAAK